MEMRMNRDKEDLLKHYASCQVQEFYQFDG